MDRDLHRKRAAIEKCTWQATQWRRQCAAVNFGALKSKLPLIALYPEDTSKEWLAQLTFVSAVLSRLLCDLAFSYVISV